MPQIKRTSNTKRKTIKVSYNELGNLSSAAFKAHSKLRDLEEEGRKRDRALDAIVGVTSLAMGQCGPIGAFTGGYLSAASLGQSVDKNLVTEDEQYDIFAFYYETFEAIRKFNIDNSKQITHIEIVQEFTQFKEGFDEGLKIRWEDAGYLLLDPPYSTRIKYDGEWVDPLHELWNFLKEFFN